MGRIKEVIYRVEFFSLFGYIIGFLFNVVYASYDDGILSTQITHFRSLELLAAVFLIGFRVNFDYCTLKSNAFITQFVLICFIWIVYGLYSNFQASETYLLLMESSIFAVLLGLGSNLMRSRNYFVALVLLPFVVKIMMFLNLNGGGDYTTALGFSLVLIIVLTLYSKHVVKVNSNSRRITSIVYEGWMPLIGFLVWGVLLPNFFPKEIIHVHYSLFILLILDRVLVESSRYLLAQGSLNSEQEKPVTYLFYAGLCILLALPQSFFDIFFGVGRVNKVFVVYGSVLFGIKRWLGPIFEENGNSYKKVDFMLISFMALGLVTLGIFLSNIYLILILLIPQLMLQIPGLWRKF